MSSVTALSMLVFVVPKDLKFDIRHERWEMETGSQNFRLPQNQKGYKQRTGRDQYRSVLAHPLVELLRQQRIDKGITQSELGAKFFTVQENIYRWESPKGGFTSALYRIDKWAKALGGHIEYRFVPDNKE